MKHSLSAINTITGQHIFPKRANKVDHYICFDCHEDVIFCHGAIKEPYFRHYSDTSCCNRYNHPGQSQIHKDAKIFMKDILQSGLHISVIRQCSSCNTEREIEIPSITETSTIELEYSFEYDGIKIADIAHIDTNRIKCIFEIYYTHKTMDENRPNPWFEIQASELLSIANSQEQVLSKLIPIQIHCIRKEYCKPCFVKKEEKLKEDHRLRLEKRTRRIELLQSINRIQDTYVQDMETRSAHYRADIENNQATQTTKEQRKRPTRTTITPTTKRRMYETKSSHQKEEN